MTSQLSESGAVSVPLTRVEVRCELAGQGSPPFVLIHGLGASHALWRDVQPALAASGRTLSLDLRGAGETRAREELPFTLETWADDLHELLQALEFEPAVLVAHSLGAAVALRYTLAYPAEVRGLVVMGADPDLAHLAPRMLAAAELIEREGLAEWVESRWAQNTPFSATSLAREPEMLGRYRAILLANDPADYVRTCRAIATAEPLSGRIGELAAPLLVIVGDEDDRTLPEHGRALAEAAPEASVVELAGVGHTMPFEAPAEVSAAVVAFAHELAV